MEPTREAPQPGSSEERSVARYLREIARFPPLSAAAEGALVLDLPKPEAATALIEGYLSYVVQIARQYQDQGVPLMDLIGEGNLCLVQAIQTFHTRPAAPLHRSLEGELHQTMQQALCAHDPQVTRLPLETVAQDRALLPTCRNPEDALVAKVACAGILAILERLSPRQRQALAHYYGFAGQVHGSFAAIGRELGIRASAVRSSFIEGLHTLRRARRELRELLDDAFSPLP